MKYLDEKLTTILENITSTLKFPIFIFLKDSKELIFNSNNEIFPTSLIEAMKEFYFSKVDLPKYFIKRLTFEELYIAFDFKNNNKEYLLIAGPLLSYFPLTKDGYEAFAFSKSISFEHYLSIKKRLEKFDLAKIVNVLVLLYSIVNGISLSKKEIINVSKDHLVDDQSLEIESKNLIKKRIIEYESKYSFNDELKIVNLVSSGDIETISKIPSILFNKVDKIIENSERSDKYLAVTLITLISRAAINGGMNIYSSLSKSDHYIRRIDNASTQDEISVILKQMIYDYTYEVYKIKNKKKYSSKINKAINFITLNIHSHISLDDIAEYVDLNPKYLSRRFLEEVGIKISTYTKKLRLEEAKSLLKYSNEDYTTIAYKLCFPSQSYFVEVFKKEYGITPKVYRENNSKMF